MAAPVNCAHNLTPLHPGLSLGPCLVVKSFTGKLGTRSSQLGSFEKLELYITSQKANWGSSKNRQKFPQSVSKYQISFYNPSIIAKKEGGFLRNFFQKYAFRRAKEDSRYPHQLRSTRTKRFTSQEQSSSSR